MIACCMQLRFERYSGALMYEREREREVHAYTTYKKKNAYIQNELFSFNLFCAKHVYTSSCFLYPYNGC